MSSVKPIQHEHISYESQGQYVLLNPNTGKQIRLFSVRLLNNSGSALDMGLLRRLSSSIVDVFSYDGSSATNITSTVNAGSAFNICTTTSGSGLLIQSTKRMNSFGFVVSSAQTGSPTITLQYWNGSAFANVPYVIKTISSFGSGFQLLVIASPRDWVVGNAGVSGLSNSEYTFRISVASSGNTPQATSLVVGSIIDFNSNVSDDSALEIGFSEKHPFVLDAGEGIIPYFSTASNNNCVTSFYAQED